jgi:hypothetical protein
MAAVAVSTVMAVVTGDAVLAPALLVLIAGVYYLSRDPGPPVLALAFAFQWMQVTAALLYYDFAGRRVRDMDTCDWAPMVLLALGCLVALLVGLLLGKRWERRRRGPLPPLTAADGEALGRTPTLAIAYIVAALSAGLVTRFAFEVPALTQGILAMGLLRLALLFLLLRRLVRPPVRWFQLAAVIGFEILIGFTGFFAGFREALMMTALAFLEIFNRRRPAHWLALGGVATIAVLTALVWTGIKRDVRKQFGDDTGSGSEVARLDRVNALSAQWVKRSDARLGTDLDRMVSRLWAIPYQAMALRRVPGVRPYENGAILGRAVMHVLMPRLFFPDKADVGSDSDMVRKYSGVWVAGAEHGTSIAFGYAAESYIDFGIPGMFVPVLLFGVLMGGLYSALLRAIRNRELAVGVVSAVFWVALYLYERSWIKMLGTALTLILFLGWGTVLVDRLLSRRAAARARTEARRAAARSRA